MLHFRTQIAMLYKVQARANIDGNKQHDKLTKMGQKQANKNVGARMNMPTPPILFLKDWWHSMHKTLVKGHIRHLKKHILNIWQNKQS